MNLITERLPDSWQDLEKIVTSILRECGMNAERQVTLNLPRGSINVDVLAEENSNGIKQTIICECKNWSTNIPKEVVHSFRSVMQETGANRGYIVSRVGFQSGAVETAQSTNIELVTFHEFQNIYFEKWISSYIWEIEREIGSINTYYEPSGKPGYALLSDESETEYYDDVWNKYLFVGLILVEFSPYIRKLQPRPYPELPFDTRNLEKWGVTFPEAIGTMVGYREFLETLRDYAVVGLKELRAVNPLTRGRPAEEIDRDD